MKLIADKQLFLRRFCLILLDILSVLGAAILSLLMRFNLEIGSIQAPYLERAWTYAPIAVISTLIIFNIFRLYSSLWVFAGTNELESIVAGSCLSTVAYYVGTQILSLQQPRSVYFLYLLCLTFFVGLTRFGYRAIRRQINHYRNKDKGTNVLIVGAGEAGNMTIREINSSSSTDKHVRCVLDDDTTKIGNYIQGVKIVGGTDDIAGAVAKYSIDEIIIAMPSASKAVISGIVDNCKELKCALKILPGIKELVDGSFNMSQLRTVQIEDLLGRDPVTVDLDSVMGYISGKVVMVTGGGGSIGSELCRQLASHRVGKLIIVDIYENNAYNIQQELLTHFPQLDLVVLIASVRNTERINKIFETYKPQIVFHAAAHKHVPLMEVSPNEAIKNNVFGTLKTVKAANKYGVERFVLISTDKAVNPTNIMGATKRICEMIVQSYNRISKTEYVAVRFGNVLGSNGSVIPLFKRQIEEGGPVTVTHPDIIRYFMTIPEAVSLVLQAGAFAKGGEIFVLDMGAPVKILELAENMIRLMGYIPYQDIDIKFTGLRPGEKLFEEMLMDEEGLQDTDNKLIHIGKPIKMNSDSFLERLEELYSVVIKEPDNDEVKRIVMELVPTYKPKDKPKGKYSGRK